MPTAAEMEDFLRTILRTKFGWRLTPERGTTSIVRAIIVDSGAARGSLRPAGGRSTG
jgi:hypothetical protein